MVNQARVTFVQIEADNEAVGQILATLENLALMDRSGEGGNRRGRNEEVREHLRADGATAVVLLGEQINDTNHGTNEGDDENEPEAGAPHGSVGGEEEEEVQADLDADEGGEENVAELNGLETGPEAEAEQQEVQPEQGEEEDAAEPDDPDIKPVAEEEEHRAQPELFMKPGRIYHSTQVHRNGEVVGIGPGYQEVHGHYRAAGTGQLYDLNDPPPGLCFNCNGHHWRVHCPHATGNQTVF